MVEKKEVKIIMQARMGSERLPGKVLTKIQDKSLLGHILTRMQKSRLHSGIIVATSTDAIDDAIERECDLYGVDVFRGSNSDVLSRFYHAAITYDARHILRFCCDNPFADPIVTDQAISYYQSNNYGYVATKNFPLGINMEIFPFEELEKAHESGKQPYHREHVTPYIIENAVKSYFESETDDSHYRMTVDTEDDMHFAQTVYEKLYAANPFFSCRDILALLEREPKIKDINKHVIQKKASD